MSDLAIEALANSCTRMRSLDIGKCDVTDLGLRDLSRHCPNLRKLSVRGCELITDQERGQMSFDLIFLGSSFARFVTMYVCS